MENFDSLNRKPDSLLSKEVNAHFPSVMNRIQGVLNLYGGAFSPMVHADILRSMQQFTPYIAASNLLDTGKKYRMLTIEQKIAHSFADFVTTVAIASVTREQDRDLDQFTRLLISIRDIK